MRIFKLLYIVIIIVFGYCIFPCQSATKQHDEKGVQDRTYFNPLIPDNIADPSVVMFDSVFYMYATTDIDRGLREMGPPVVWKSRDFVNWSFNGIIIPDIDWNKPYEYIDNEGNPQTGYFRYWAPGKPLKKDGKYYLFPTIVKPDQSLGTYVMVADHPEGPFEFVTGSGLCFNETCPYESQPLIDDIDGEPFLDDDGQAYIYWRSRFASKLSDDYLSLEGAVISIPTSHGGYSEGPVMFKRNNLYYYVYTLSGHANYCNAYMISQESPLGPFESPDGDNIFIYTNLENNVWGPGHGNVFQMPDTDDYYFLYLEYGEGSTTRQVFANKMEFTDDGEIVTIKPDYIGVGYLGPRHDKEPNFAINSIVTASSSKNTKIVEAYIIEDPNQYKNLGVTVDAGLKAEREFIYTPENAIDELNNTRWQASENDKTPWFMLDLGEVKVLNRSKMFFLHPAMGHSWVLEKSDDGKVWNKAGIAEEPVSRSPHIVEGIGKARFLRLTITSGKPGLWRFELY